MQDTRVERCCGENLVEIVVRDKHGTLQWKMELPVANSLDLTLIMGRIVEFSAILKDPPPRTQFMRINEEQHQEVALNRNAVEGSSVPLLQQSNGTVTNTTMQQVVNTASTPMSYAAVTGNASNGGNSGRNGQVTFNNLSRASTGYSNGRSQGNQGNMIDLTWGNGQNDGLPPVRPLPCGPVFEPLVVDASDQERWKTNECWQARLIGGTRLKRAWIHEEAKRFPVCKFRDADYLWPSGKAQLFMWFTADAREQDVLEFMRHVSRHIVPSDSNLMKPGKYNLIPSKVNPGTKGTKKGKSKPGIWPRTGEASSQPRILARQWTEEESGAVVKIVQCSKMNLAFPEIKDNLRRAGLVVEKVYLSRIESARDAILCTFHKEVDDAVAAQVVEHLTIMLEAKGFEVLEPTETHPHGMDVTETEKGHSDDDDETKSPNKRKRDNNTTPEQLERAGRLLDKTAQAKTLTNMVQQRLNFKPLEKPEQERPTIGSGGVQQTVEQQGVGPEAGQASQLTSSENTS